MANNYNDDLPRVHGHYTHLPAWVLDFYGIHRNYMGSLLKGGHVLHSWQAVMKIFV